MATALFMFVGQGTDWTTAISSFLLSLEQFLLLGICIMFDVKNRGCKSPCAKKPDDKAEYEQLPNIVLPQGGRADGSCRLFSTVELPPC
jgi:hypothetical protein